MKNLFILLLSLLVLSSCGKSNSNSSDGVVTIEIGSPDKKEVKLSSLVDSVSYIPLETKNDLLIGQLAKLVVSDDYIYILDEFSSVFCFNRQGKFIRKIGNKGVGPGEYTDIDDIDVYHQHVYLFDGGLHKLFIYNADGSLKQEVKIDYWTEKMKVVDDSWVALYGGYKTNKKYAENGKTPNLAFWNIHTGELKPFCFFNPEIRMEEVTESFKLFTDFNSFLSPLDNKLYRMDAVTGLDEKVDFVLEGSLSDAHKRYVDAIEKENVGLDRVMEFIQGFPAWISVNETSKYLVFSYSLKNHSCMIFYNKDDASSVYACSAAGKSPVIDDIDGVFRFFVPYGSHGDMLYGIVQPYELEPDKFGWAKDIKEEDNPIIVAMHMK